MDNLKNDKYYAEKSVEQIDIINNYVSSKTYKDFISNNQLVDAVMFRLVQMIENIRKISTDFKTNNPQIPWGKIIGFRNGIVHEYGKTDYTIVYEVITENLNQLKEVLSSII